MAYISKYVDTSFMTPYVHTGPQDTGDVRIKVVEDGNAFVAYPNPFRQKVNIQVESGELKVESGVAIAWLTDMQGRREEVRLTPAGNGKYTLDLTSRGSARGCPISFGALSFFCKKLQFYFAMSDIFRIFAFVNQYDNPWQR